MHPTAAAPTLARLVSGGLALAGAVLWQPGVAPAYEVTAGPAGIPSAAGEGDFLNLTITGELRPETREALARLLEPGAIARLRNLALERGKPLEEVCMTAACPPNVEGALERGVIDAAEGARGPPTELPTTEAVTIPGIEAVTTERRVGRSLCRPSPGGRLVCAAVRSSAPKREAYAVIAPDSPVLKTVRPEARARGPVAVPLDDEALARVLARGDAVVVPTPGVDSESAPAAARPSTFTLTVTPEANDKLALIERDLEVVGSSDRQYRLSSALSEAERNDLLTTIRQDPAVAAPERVAAPTGGFSFIHPEAITFQTAAEGCGAAVPGWPFDAASIKKVMEFNEKVRHAVGLTAIRRSRLLIVDTGLGSGLARHAGFSTGLFAEPDELLMAHAAVRDSSGNLVCLDRNGNEYYSDVYGAGPVPGDDDPGCGKPSYPLDQLEPPPRKSTSLQVYAPEHGGFVAGLALGGPGLLSAFPEIARYVGLSVFRVARPGDVPEQSVKTDSSDLKASLLYAGFINADVVNLSLKTNKEAPFIELGEKTKALLVVAAGNAGEDLDRPAPGNLPASLDRDRDRMLVVAALQPDANDPWWSQSAHSRTTGRVDIAAPGADITSFGLDGGKSCASGTSAAAPLVAFTAATLKALGLSRREIVRARVLASADHDPRLADKVADGRRLNVAAALDVFVDRVRVGAEGESRRGWIEPDTRPAGPGAPPPRFALCPFGTTVQPMAAHRGAIDLSLLWTWRRKAGAGGAQDEGVFHHRLNNDTSFDSAGCEIPGGSFAFFDLATGRTGPIQWSEVRTILPTPFRAAAVRDAVLRLGMQAAGPAGGQP